MFHRNSPKEDKEMGNILQQNEKISNNSPTRDPVGSLPVVPGHRGASRVEGRQGECGPLCSGAEPGGGHGAGGRQVCFNKHSRMNSSPVQGKEKTKLAIVSSVSLLGKIKRWQPTLVPKTIFEILLWCKITIWEPP